MLPYKSSDNADIKDKLSSILNAIPYIYKTKTLKILFTRV